MRNTEKTEHNQWKKDRYSSRLLASVLSAHVEKFSKISSNYSKKKKNSLTKTWDIYEVENVLESTILEENLDVLEPTINTPLFIWWVSSLANMLYRPFILQYSASKAFLPSPTCCLKQDKRFPLYLTQLAGKVLSFWQEGKKKRRCPFVSTGLLYRGGVTRLWP